MNKVHKSFHALGTSFSLAIISIFALWWFNPTHVPNNFHGYYRIFDLVLFLLITYIIWHPILMTMLSWSIASHIKKIKHVAPADNLKVAVITTFVPSSESTSLLHKTLPALVAIDYEHDTWVLDEGDDPEVKKICEKYGVNHFSRHGIDHYNKHDGKFARRTKGGNHNSWYDTAGNEYDVVAQMDTDFIAHKNYLLKTLGYFKDPNVAFVGTPQVYGNTKSSLIARGAAQQTFNFYGPILRGMDGMETTLLIGANHVIRVSALKEVDHYSAHITEDLLTGMKLHSKGWKSVYVPEALAIGEGPTDWKSYFSQQKRWAYGCMHILFNHSPKLFREMKVKRSVYYLLIQQHYFSGLAMAVSVLCLTLYFAFGLTTSDMNLLPFLAFYLPVLAVGSVMSLWMQKFNVRPKIERGIMWAGMYINIASWPIFFMAFLSLFKSKKLIYQVTPKGGNVRKSPTIPIGLFTPHLIIGSISLIGVLSSFHTGRDAPIMLFWAILSTLLMFLVPIVIPFINIITKAYQKLVSTINTVNRHYKIFEFKTLDKESLPNPPTDNEKYSYATRKVRFLMGFSIISFIGISISMFNFVYGHPILWGFIVVLGFSVAYFAVSLIVTSFTSDFDVEEHKKLVKNWTPSVYPSVDIFLPVCGEPLRVLNNTWTGVKDLINKYPGQTTVYCLDDGDSSKVRELAHHFGYTYVVRPNRGYYKKAGNLRHGYRNSSSEFIAIFDADFLPRNDLLTEMLPYFENNKIAIVQSPQYFDVGQHQNWLERGAGAVQELFYRMSQVSRQSHDAAICVGSNALYRRIALDQIGGTALIEHSEDVYTGFNLRKKGWSLQYIPIVLAKGLCPSSMTAFFKQQYRWCMGSLSLLTSDGFWGVKMSFRGRLSYISGFMYYVHTGITSIYAPMIPLILLIFLPAEISLINYFLIFPAFVFTQLIYPIWHRSTYGVEAWATQAVYGWAHLFAVVDTLTNKPMAWQPTGSKVKKDIRYTTYRVMQILFNLVPALIWVYMSAYYMITLDYLAYMPILVTGLYYLLITLKVSTYIHKPFKLTHQEKIIEAQPA